MNVIDFRFINLNDKVDTKYEAWSRIYEYPVVLDVLNKLGANSNSKIHNTSWGFVGCHVTFKNDLDNLYENCLHSDIKQSNLSNTMVYDITKKLEDKYLNYFDFVLNISTVEEVNHPNVDVINNLFEQVKPGGYLIITFDYNKYNNNSYGNGSINLLEVEKYVGKTCKLIEENSINGSNSIFIQSECQHLNCGLLVLQK
jgi:SAM-dependent methyltransferase